MKFSLNNHFILEAYVPTGLRSERQNGIAMPGQKDGIKGLKVLIATTLSDGRQIPAGSTAYVKEELLHTQAWAKKFFTSDFMTDKFMIVNLEYIEFVSTPDEVA